jgi:iron complex outermembrane recepter protein
VPARTGGLDPDRSVIDRGIAIAAAGVALFLLVASGHALAQADDPFSLDEPAPRAESADSEDTPAPAELPVIAVGSDPAPPVTRGDATELDTIQVTASKRLKSERDLPASIGAIRGDDLEQIKAQGLSDYLKQIPGISLIDYGTGQQIPVIRGIASSISPLGTQFTALTTGIFLDDMPFTDLFAPMSMPDLNPFDLERVEVLKGPQGTLFGSGALAGAIRYVVHKPVHSAWQAKLSGTYSQTGFAEEPSRIGAFALNVPLFGDAVAIRMAGVYREDAGFYDAVPNEDNTRHERDINHLKQFTGRILASWNATDRLRISGFYFGQDTDQADDGHADNPERPERGDMPFASPTETGFGGGNLSVNYEFDRAQVLYSGNLLEKDSYSRGHQERAFGLGNQEDIAWYNLIKGRVEGQTHELRLMSAEGGDFSHWEWLVGAAHMNYRQNIFQFSPNPGPAGSGYYANPPNHPEDVPVIDRATSFLWATVDGDGTEQAVFGELTRRLGEHWEVTAGARAFETELISDTRLAGAQISLLFPGELERRDQYHVQERGVNPKFSLRYLHDRHMQLYLLAAKGYQFGGFQLNPPALGIEEAAEQRGFHFGPYKSSELWNYELGLRTEWLDRRVRFDLTAFYLDWTNLQLTIAVPLNPFPLPIPPETGVPQDVTYGVIANVGAAHSRGLEASFEVVPFRGAKFTSAAAWVRAITEVPFDEEHDDGPVPAGTRLPGTPHFQWANILSYQFDLPYLSRWGSILSLTHSHIGASPNNLRATGTVGGYDTLDANWTLFRHGSGYVPELTFGVNNLTDTRGIAASTISPTLQQIYFIRPRTTLMSLSWRY